MTFRQIPPRLTMAVVLLVSGFLMLAGSVFASTNAIPSMQATCGDTCYVNATTGNDANSGASPGTAKQTIQAAVDAVNPGGEVIVASGTYTESVEIAKGLTLTGDADTCGPGADAPVVTGISTAFSIIGDVDGLTINGFDIRNSLTGVFVASDVVTDGVSITNNTFDNVSTSVQLVSTAQHQNWTISCNEITADNVSGSGLLLHNIDGVEITQNTLKDGVGLIALRASDEQTMQDVVIQNNMFETPVVSGVELAIFDNIGSSTLTNIAISDNTFIGSNYIAISMSNLSSQNELSYVAIEDNSFDIELSTRTSIVNAFNVEGSNNFTGNTVSVEKLSGEINAFNITGNLTGQWLIDDNDFTNELRSSIAAAIRINSNMPETVVIDVKQNTVDGFRFGVRASTLPTGADVNVNRNDFHITLSGTSASQAGEEIDGTCNWWGSETGPVSVPDLFNFNAVSAAQGNVDASTWLLENDLENGFCGDGSSIRPLAVVALCSDDPANDWNWQITNPNASPVAFDWVLGNESGFGSVDAGEAIDLTTPNGGDNLLVLSADGMTDVRTPYLEDPACLYDVTVEKVVDTSSGNPLLNPAQEFEICPSGLPAACVTFTESGEQTMTLPAGTYDIEETSPGPLWMVDGEGEITVNADNPTAEVTITNTARNYTPLTLETVCSTEPDSTRNWQITNSNAYLVSLTWRVAGSGDTGPLVIPGGNTVDLTVDAVQGDNTLELLAFGQVVASAAGSDQACEAMLTIDKVVNTNGNPLANPNDTFEVCATNTSTQDVQCVSVTDALSGMLTLVYGEYAITETGPGGLWSKSGETTVTIPDTDTVTITNTAAAFSNPTLSGQCLTNADARNWLITNPNAYEVPFTWEVVGSDARGDGTISANGQLTFSTPANEIDNSVLIFVGGQQVASAGGNVQPCEALALSALCTDDLGVRNWQLNNPNDFALDFTWRVVGSGVEGVDTVAANGQVTFSTPANQTDNSLTILFKGLEVASASDSTQPCTTTVPLNVTKQVNLNNNPFVNASQPFEICAVNTVTQSRTCGTINGGGMFILTLEPGSYAISETDPGAIWTVSGETTITVPDTSAVTITNTADAYTAPVLTGLCTDDPIVRNWQISNPNPYDVPFTWDVVGSDASGGDTIPANGQMTFSTPANQIDNSVTIFVNGGQVATVAANDAPCTVVVCPAPITISGLLQDRVSAGQLLPVQVDVPAGYESLIGRVDFELNHLDTTNQPRVTSLSDTAAPFSFRTDSGWDTTNAAHGTHRLVATAYTPAGDPCGTTEATIFIDRGITPPPLVCPSGTTQVNLFDTPTKLRTTSPQTITAPLNLPGDAGDGSQIIVWNMGGHPEVGCPGVDHPYCGQNQQYETFDVLVDGGVVASVPDPGEDVWGQSIFPLTLPAGDHTITMSHTGFASGGVESVSILAAYCYAP